MMPDDEVTKPEGRTGRLVRELELYKRRLMYFSLAVAGVALIEIVTLAAWLLGHWTQLP